MNVSKYWKWGAIALIVLIVILLIYNAYKSNKNKALVVTTNGGNKSFLEKVSDKILGPTPNTTVVTLAPTA
jgi:uncharacterized membrane protein YukC